MRIFFVHSGNEQFVKLDRDLLSESFDVREFYAPSKFPSGFLQYWRGIKSAEVVFCWFASWNSFWALLLSALLKKKSLLVIGGYDLANLPEANYGSQRGGLPKLVSRWAMHLATVLLTNSYYSQKEAEHNAGIPAERVQVIYHGVPDPFGVLPTGPREPMALTVGNVDRPNLKRKGLEPFVRAAALLPDVHFVVVGAWVDDAIERLRSIASSNVIFTGRVSEDELLGYYRRASVYVQASLHEGFGMSVAEAMLAGCIPVTTQAGSLPEVVGECGFFSISSEPKAITKAIESALEGSPTLRKQARLRILVHFPIQNRRQALKQIIQSVSMNDYAKR